MLSAVRFWTIMGLRVFDEIPDEYLPVRYGPPLDDGADEAVDEKEVAAAEHSRSVANALRAVA